MCNCLFFHCEMEAGSIVGIVLGILAAAIIVFVIIFFYLNKRKKGELLITDKVESPVAYSNGGFTGGRVNVVDYTEIPFAFAEPARPKLNVPAQKMDVPVCTVTPHDESVTNSTAQTSGVLVDATHENSTAVSVSVEDAFHEIDFHDFDDDDYATLDSVAKIRSKKGDDAETRKSHHAVETPHMAQTTVPGKENECEYATVVPKSLRGNQDSFREKTETIDNIHQSSDLFHTMGKDSPDQLSEMSNHELSLEYL